MSNGRRKAPRPPPNAYDGNDPGIVARRMLPYVALVTREMGLPQVRIDDGWIDQVIGFEIAMKAILKRPNAPIPARFAHWPVDYWIYIVREYADTVKPILSILTVT